MVKLGLIGERLSHSYSPAIHKLLHGESYELFELSRDELAMFFEKGGAFGVNVTIPYKRSVMEFCSTLSPEAEKVGSVNTMVRKDGLWHGHNTDYYGFLHMVEKSGVSVSGKKSVVLGSGGASKAVVAVLEDLGASEIVVVSRQGKVNYESLSIHADAGLIVNATPVGMYPNNGESPVDLCVFKQCEAVLDLIYNPSRTKLVMQAESLGITAISGLSMLVAQAAKSAEMFLDRSFRREDIERITCKLSLDMENIVLIGMPGCGKSTVGKALAEMLGREFFDADAEIESALGKTIPQIFAGDGQNHFRALETDMLQTLGKKSGAVIATGGGCVTRSENYEPLHQNGKIIWIIRDLCLLETGGRPVSQSTDVSDLYEQRRALYETFADATVRNCGEVDLCCERIKEALT